MQEIPTRTICIRILPVICFAAIAGCSWVRAVVDRRTNEAERLTQAARRAEESGELDEAASLLTRAVELSPEEVDIRRRLGEVLLSQGRKREAADHFQFVLSETPDDAGGHARLARLLFELDRLDDAEQRVDAALALEPRLAQALLLKSELAERRHDNDAALEACYRVLAADRDNVEAQLRIAAIHLRSSQPDRAAPLLRSICQNPRATDEQTSDARWSLGVAYGELERWDEAADTIAEALERRPNAPAEDWYRLAYAHYLAGELDAASRALARSLEVQPDHTDSLTLASMLNGGAAPNQIAPVGYVQPVIPIPSGW